MSNQNPMPHERCTRCHVDRYFRCTDAACPVTLAMPADFETCRPFTRFASVIKTDFGTSAAEFAARCRAASARLRGTSTAK